MRNKINKQQILLNKMKNFTTCLTRPTGESYKSPGGIMRYMMLLLMFLVAGVGMAQTQTEYSVTFTCGNETNEDETHKYDFYQKTNNKTCEKSGIYLTFNNDFVENVKKNYVKISKDHTIQATSTSKTITKIGIYAVSDNPSNGEITGTLTEISFQIGADAPSGWNVCNSAQNDNGTGLEISSTKNQYIQKITVYYKEKSIPTGPYIEISNFKASSTTVKTGEEFTITGTLTGSPESFEYWIFRNETNIKNTYNYINYGESSSISFTTKEAVPNKYYYHIRARVKYQDANGEDQYKYAETENIEVTVTDNDYKSIQIEEQEEVSVKAGGMISLTVAHPDKTSDRYYAWYAIPYEEGVTPDYLTDDKYLINIYSSNSSDGTKNPGKDSRAIKTRPMVEGEYWYYCVLTCKDDGVENVQYRSNMIHVTVTQNTDGLVVVTPIENQETVVFNKTTVFLEINEDDDKSYTYQWYKAPANKNQDGVAIDKATKASYTFTPTATGVEYYYCVIESKWLVTGPNGEAAGTRAGILTSRVGKVTITEATPDIDVNDMKLEMVNGVGKSKKVSFTATVGSTTVYDKLTFTYKIGDTNVATVDENGNITPENAGTTTITVTSAAQEGLFFAGEGTATITVVNEELVPDAVFTCSVGPNDKGGFDAPVNEDDVYEGNVLLVRIYPDVNGVTFTEDENGNVTWDGITFDNGTWTTTDNKTYEIYYTTSDDDVRKMSGSKPAGKKYTGSIRISQTMTVKAAVWDTSAKKWSDVGEREFLFNFTLLKTITSGLQLEPGKGYAITEDGKTYVTTTYGSLGDTNKGNPLWDAAKKDPSMNGSEIAGFEYHSIGNKDANGENKWDYDNCEYANETYKYDGEADYEKLNTFDIPITGAYFMFEPEVDGQLNVIVRQNGIVGSNGSELTDELKKVVKRYAFVCDETGKPIEDLTPLISSKSRAEGKGFAFDEEYFDAGVQDKATSKERLMSYMVAFYKAQHDTEEYQNKDDATVNAAALAYWKQCKDDYITLEKDENGKITYKDKKTCDLPNIVVKDTYGCYTFGKAYVRYSFPVRAGKTYFMMGRWTKLAPCGYSFKRSIKDNEEWRKFVLGDGTAGNPGRRVTIDGTATTGVTELPAAYPTEERYTPFYETEDENGNKYMTRDKVGTSGEHRIILNRSFRANVWTSLVVPFSMSPTTVKEVFGPGTEIIHFNQVDNKSNKLYVTKHFHQMIVAGTPVFIKPTQDVASVRIYGTYEPETPIWEMDGNHSNDWHITGSYTPATVPVGAYLMGYNPTSGVNNLRHITMPTDVPGTRAWIVNSKKSDAKIEGLYINGVEDNTTTVIEEILYGEEPSTVKGTRANGVYSLSGQLVRANTTDTTGLPAGIYIAGGRKVVVR